jgi:hypothetical protein
MRERAEHEPAAVGRGDAGPDDGQEIAAQA